MTYSKLDSCFDSLFVIPEVRAVLDGLEDGDLDKIFSKLLFLDSYGVYTEYFKVEYLEGRGYEKIFEIKIKLSSKREFRILVTKCSSKKSPADYLLLHAFFKKTQKITDKDKKLAKKRMINEGL